MTHAHETFGDQVKQEAANEFMGIEGHGLFSVVIFSIPVTEGDFSVVGRENPIIGERHAVGVATEVVEDMDGRSERFFGIDDPGFFSQGVEEELEGYGVGQEGGLTHEEEFVLSENLLEQVEELTPQNDAQGFNREQKVLTGRPPALLIEGQGARRDQTMEMKMI